MKKKQRNKIKNGGQTARQAYEQFVVKPEWLHHIPFEEIPHIRKVLDDLFEVYKDRHYKANSEYQQYTQERPDYAKAREALERMGHAANLSMAAYYLTCAMQRYQRNPPPDLSLYARDN